MSRCLAAAALCVALVQPAAAQQGDYDCDRVAEVVMVAVNARADGAPQDSTRDTLRAELGQAAGDELTAWVYALPEGMLTDAVGEAWKSQCESL